MNEQLIDGMYREVEEKTIEQLELEINTLTHQARYMALGYIIQIGNRLIEAKAMVNHGEWANWLVTKVNYSQSTANNFMRIAEEYGDNQINLFVPSNSQALENLGYTKLVALLAVPAEDRAEFAENVGAENLSTREFTDKIKKLTEERDEAVHQLEVHEKMSVEWEQKDMEEQDKLKAERDELRKEADRLQVLIAELENPENETENGQASFDDAALDEIRKEAAEKATTEINKKLAQLESQVKKANDKADKLQKEIDKNDEKIKQAAKDAAAKAETDTKEIYETSIEQLKKDKADAVEKQNQLEKKLALSGNPSIQRFGFYFEQAQKDIDEMQKAIKILIESGETETAEKFRTGCKQVILQKIDQI